MRKREIMREGGGLATWSNVRREITKEEESSAWSNLKQMPHFDRRKGYQSRLQATAMVERRSKDVNCFFMPRAIFVIKFVSKPLRRP